MKENEFDVLSCPLDGWTLVEASAGTGKTWNIGGLYLRFLLEKRLEVKDILVVEGRVRTGQHTAFLELLSG